MNDMEYRLKKDLPTAKAGAVLTGTANTEFFADQDDLWVKIPLAVQSEWLEEIEQRVTISEEVAYTLLDWARKSTTGYKHQAIMLEDLELKLQSMVE